MGSVTIFIVQPDGELLPERKDINLPRRAFTSRQAANQWTKINFPPGLNPFERCQHRGSDRLTIYYPTPTSEDTHYSYTDEEPEEVGYCRRISVPHLRRLIQQFGLTPPEYEYISPIRDAGKERVWYIWWEEASQQMTIEQMTSLWRFLAPNPWLIFEVPAEL